MDIEKTIDARNTCCPVPIIELAKGLHGLECGKVAVLLATDPATESDVRAFCASTGHELLGVLREGEIVRALVRKRSSI